MTAEKLRLLKRAVSRIDETPVNGRLSFYPDARIRTDAVIEVLGTTEGGLIEYRFRWGTYILFVEGPRLWLWVDPTCPDSYEPLIQRQARTMRQLRVIDS